MRIDQGLNLWECYVRLEQKVVRSLWVKPFDNGDGLAHIIQSCASCTALQTLRKCWGVGAIVTASRSRCVGVERVVS